MIRRNLERVRERIDAAARAVGRARPEVRLIAVTKGVPVERIREALACGVTEIGENRVQEAREKQAELGRGIAWHLIGTLQRNKAALAADLFRMVHSVDSLELAEALDRAVALRPIRPSEKAEERWKPLEVLLQVNVLGEPTRHGCPPASAPALAEAFSRCAHLRLSGLMTLAPYGEDPEAARPVFRKLRLLRDELRDTGLSLPNLSMGMSRDFEVAVQEGATMVRLGTAIFGERTA